jgi:hypothetical protein
MPTTSKEDKPDRNGIQGVRQLEGGYASRRELKIAIAIRVLTQSCHTRVIWSVKRLNNGTESCQIPSL